MTKDWVLVNTTTWEQIISRCPLDFRKQQSPLEFLENHVKNNPDGLACCYPNQNFDGYIEVTFENLVEITERIYCNLMKGPLKDVKPGSWITVALDYTSASFFMTLALMRADMKHLYITQYEDYQTIDRLMDNIQSPLCYMSTNTSRSGDRTKMINRICELQRFTLEEVYTWPITTAGKDQLMFRNARQNELDEVVWAIYSSDVKTDTPRPIYMTNQRVIIDSLDEISLHQPKGTPNLPCTTNSSQSKVVVNSHVEYLYDPKHKHLTIGPCGESITLLTGSLFCIIAGITVIHPLQKSLTITPQDILNSLKLGQVSKMNAYSDTLGELSEFLSTHQEKWTDLRLLDTIICGRPPIPKSVADCFLQKGINLESCYRSAKTGLIMWTPANGKIGELTPLSFASYDFNSTDRLKLQNEVYELFIPSNAPQLASRLCPSGEKAYKTGEMFYMGSESDHWIYWGREDALLVHHGGLKTNAGLIEREMIALNACVRKVCVVGDGMDRPLMLVELNKYNVQIREDSIKEVIKTAEHINEKFTWCNQPKIPPNDIYILPPGETLPRNSKGLIQHQAVMMQFDEIIKQLYQRC